MKLVESGECFFVNEFIMVLIVRMNLNIMRYNNGAQWVYIVYILHKKYKHNLRSLIQQQQQHEINGCIGPGGA